MSIVELRTLAEDPKNWPALRDELKHRKTGKARRLASDLATRMAKPGTEPSLRTVPSAPVQRTAASPARVAKKPAKKATATGTRPQADREAAPVSPERRDLEERFELLRQTFTLEGEVLARWGMTPALPREFRKLVFDLWVEWLRNGGTDAQRTPERMEQDIRKLEAEERSDGEA